METVLWLVGSVVGGLFWYALRVSSRQIPRWPWLYSYVLAGGVFVMPLLAVVTAGSVVRGAPTWEHER